MDKRCTELYKKARNNPVGIRFSELENLCKCIDMMLDRVNGSHHIYKRRDNPPYRISIQKMNDGKAKPYQVRQLIDFIATHGIMEEKEV